MGRSKQVLADRNAGLSVPGERQTRGQQKRERGSACGASRSLAGNGKRRRNREVWIASRPASIGGKRPDVSTPEAFHGSFLALCELNPSL